ncbi:MAG: gliding motility-associated C-terminal domain-containing protein [Bacteroidetes bacterium]|nr:gliding motility-associated C-terminal domain-containing protein [Bacteroidota bacterium]
MALSSRSLRPFWLGLLALPAAAQNLVPNPSFDTITTCPTFASMLGLAAPWYNPTQGTPELYHACAPDGDFAGVPVNYSGGYQYPRSGPGMAGLFVFRTAMPEMREYIEVMLRAPLEAGRCYQVRLYVNMPNDFELASDGIGARLTVGPLTANTGSLLPGPPDIDRPAGALITDSLGWTEVSGVYTAMGGEDHLTIGNFRNDAATSWTLFNPGVWYPGCAYLLVDDVSVEPLPDLLDLGPDTVLCPGSTLLLDATIPGATATSWNDGSTEALRTVGTAGHYSVTVTAGGCTFTDAIVVGLAPGALLELGPDRALCAGARDTLLALADPGTTVVWGDGTVGNILPIDTPGIYRATVTSACGTTTDSVRVTMDACSPDIFLPNAFTPDGDGRNDVLMPVYDPRIWRVRFTVRDRWGHAVHGSTEEAWTGDGAPPGVYVVQLEARSVTVSGTERRLMRHVTLLR